MWEKRVGCLGLGKEVTAEVGVRTVVPIGKSDSAVDIYILKKAVKGTPGERKIPEVFGAGSRCLGGWH